MLADSTVALDNQSAQVLVAQHAPSRLAAKDATLFSFSAEVADFAKNFLGWTTLASQPPYLLEEIEAFAREVRDEGLDTVVLIGQGGSTQASMTVTRLNALSSDEVMFRTMDSLSPVYVHRILTQSDPNHTLYLVASKSGTTIEPMLLSRLAWTDVCARIGVDEAPNRFVAITDPGTPLYERALDEDWRKIFPGEPSVGGRYSALSVFGLVPAALVGIDIKKMVAEAAEEERRCQQDTLDNPAVRLASFLYENYKEGRNKFSLVTPQPGRVFGLWVEQLIAESLGKWGIGILPNIEVDPSLLCVPHEDRSVITYNIRPDEESRRQMAYVDPSIPRLTLELHSVEEIARDFVIWEYAVAMVGLLLGVNPFDQPDVASTKEAFRSILYGNLTPVAPVEYEGDIYATFTPSLLATGNGTVPTTLDGALELLLSSITPGDYFSMNAFLPFTGEGRRMPLEQMRHVIADRFAVASCLEIGPRYLHSTGQFQKGGPNQGVFLLISADEPNDLLVPGEEFTLGDMERAQAQGDMHVLSQRGRRALHLHLPDNNGATLSELAKHVYMTARKVATDFEGVRKPFSYQSISYEE